MRGFATNVSNYQTDEDEQAYAEELSALLGGAHYVIDSGRNGNGSTEDWCNPPGRALRHRARGVAPTAATWTPSSGSSRRARATASATAGRRPAQFWPERALELASASGW